MFTLIEIILVDVRNVRRLRNNASKLSVTSWCFKIDQPMMFKKSVNSKYRTDVSCLKR
jgi:hypothetical protein